MAELEPRRFTLVTSVLLVVATGSLALGIERLARGSNLLGAGALVLGVAAMALAFSFKVQGDASQGTLLLLTREECMLCDKAEGILEHLQDELGFDLWTVDVSEHPELTRRWGDQVPVLFHEGEVVATLDIGEGTVRNLWG